MTPLYLVLPIFAFSIASPLQPAGHSGLDQQPLLKPSSDAFKQPVCANTATHSLPPSGARPSVPIHEAGKAVDRFCSSLTMDTMKKITPGVYFHQTSAHAFTEGSSQLYIGMGLKDGTCTREHDWKHISDQCNSAMKRIAITCDSVITQPKPIEIGGSVMEDCIYFSMRPQWLTQHDDPGRPNWAKSIVDSKEPEEEET